MQAELYVWSYCPHCQAALALLDQRGIPYEKHVMDGKDAELAEAKKRYGHNTVPIVLIDGEFIGGADSLRDLDSAGKLK
jgi:glutaredoxin 3